MARKDDNEAFAEAFLLGELDKAKSIYAEGKVDLGRPDEDSGFTYLHIACRLGLTDAARWLLDAGADVDAPVALIDCEDDDEVGATPLLVTLDSIARSRRELVEMLLEAGANLHRADLHGRGAVHRALESPELLDFVLERGADPNLRDRNGETPYMRAALMENEEAMARLEEAGASEEGMLDVELLTAAADGDPDAVADCLARGADVNYRRDGTALTAAVGTGNLELIRELLDAGADVDLAETDSEEGDFNPLLRAAYDGNAEVVQLLIDAGADLTMTNHRIGALDYAKMGKAEGREPDRPWDEVIAMLRDAGKGAAATLEGKPVEYGDVGVVDALNGALPAEVAWSRFAADGVDIFESAVIADVELLRRELPALQAVAREHGYCLGIVTWSLDEAEPRVADLKKELACASATTAAAVFDAWEAERLALVSDSSEDAYDWSHRQKVRAALTAIPEPTDAGPLRVNPGYLVLCAGGLTPLPIAYRFGGWNSAPLPHEMGLVLEHWHEAYGAELVCIDRATLAVRLPEPLATLEQVRAAAREVGLFCDESESARDDIRTAVVGQWSFWWD